MFGIVLMRARAARNACKKGGRGRGRDMPTNRWIRVGARVRVRLRLGFEMGLTDRLTVLITETPAGISAAPPGIDTSRCGCARAPG